MITRSSGEYNSRFVLNGPEVDCTTTRCANHDHSTAGSRPLQKIVLEGSHQLDRQRGIVRDLADEPGAIFWQTFSEHFPKLENGQTQAAYLDSCRSCMTDREIGILRMEDEIDSAGKSFLGNCPNFRRRVSGQTPY